MGSVELLHELVAASGLPEVRSYERLRGHGFDHEILRATLADSQQVVLRHQRVEARPLPLGQARFLAEHDVPAPALLGGNEFATLYEYVPGEMLSALVAEDRMTDDDWRSAGTAFARLHALRFPKGMKGVFGPEHLVLTPADSVRDLHELVAEAEPRLKADLPFVLPHLPRLHEVIDANAEALRETPTALLHADVYPASTDRNFLTPSSRRTGRGRNRTRRSIALPVQSAGSATARSPTGRSTPSSGPPKRPWSPSGEPPWSLT